MKKFIPNADVEYFWEYEYGFGMDFLKSLFQENYKRVYSKGGDGICDLVIYNDKIYDISFKEAKSMLIDDGKSAFRDPDKDIVMQKIKDGLNQLGLKYTSNSGKIITCKLNDNYIAKIEIVKKSSMPI